MTLAAMMTTGLVFAGQARAGTLFEDLGERPGLSRIVESAAALWQGDPRIGATFDNVNMTRFKRLLVDQLCQLSGGGCDYRGRTMQQAHKGLHLDTMQFNALAEGLQLAMDRLGVAFPVQNRLVALLAPMQRDVVTR